MEVIAAIAPWISMSICWGTGYIVVLMFRDFEFWLDFWDTYKYANKFRVIKKLFYMLSVPLWQSLDVCSFSTGFSGNFCNRKVPWAWSTPVLYKYV